MNGLTDMLRNPALQEQNMSPMPGHMVGAERKYRYGAGKPRPEQKAISPIDNPWGSIGQSLGKMATNKWGQKDLEGNLVPGQNLGGILAQKLRGMF